MHNKRQAILHTLAYSSVFHYPLTVQEIYKFLYTNKRVSTKDIVTELNDVTLPIVKKQDMYCLKGQEKWIAYKRLWETRSNKKLNRARSVARLLSILPSIMYIGVTGAVAAGQSDEDDDIDLIIITKENTLWSTRFITTALLDVLGKRRRRNQFETRNKICLNMFLSVSTLALKNHDVYTAREIIQMIPLFERENTYRKFLIENEWVSNFFANGYSETMQMKTYVSKKCRSIDRLFNFLISSSESFLQRLQLWYMKDHRTKETIAEGILAFHPIDYREHTLKEYKKVIKKYEI